MIKQDRRELNERFVRVFNMLVEQGKIIKNDRSGRGIGDVAEKILGNKAYGHIVRAYLDPDNKRVIDYGQAREFCKTYNVNEDYILAGVGTPFVNETHFDMLKAYGLDLTGSGNIMLTNEQALATPSFAVSDSFHQEENTFFSIPGVAGGNLVAFPVVGNSMDPIISNGDIIVCRQIAGPQEIKEKEMYAVCTNGSTYVKYVQPQRSRTGRITHLMLISANYLEHSPFVEEVNETTRLYKVIRRISQF